MAIGVGLILAGLLLIVYPELLSIIVATVLISAGITMASVGYHYKKMQKDFDDPFMKFFMRF